MLRDLAIVAILGVCAGLLNGADRPLRFATAAASHNNPPVNYNAPTITGDQRIGGVSHCGAGDWDDSADAPYTVTYQWLRAGVELTGQTNSTHTVVTADINQALRCDVTATNTAGTETASSATLFPPPPLSHRPPSLSGDTRLRQSLSCARGTWNDEGVPAYATSRAWLRGGTVIPGQTAATYTLTTQDVGAYISCRVSVGALASATSQQQYATPPQNLSTPDIAGDPRLGGTLSCSRGIWDDEDITPYAPSKQWLRDGVDVIGAIDDDYVVAALDVNHAISCRVRAEDLTSATSSSVYPTSPSGRSMPIIEGDARIGRTVACSRGTWDDQGRATDYEVSYEWYRAEVFVGDTVQYDVTAADVGKPLRCQVVAESLASASSQTIYPAAPDNRTIPLLSGDTRSGRTLDCSRGIWDDDGIAAYAVEYQWLRSGVAIDGETAATYTSTPADVHAGISCRVVAAGFTTSHSTTVYVQPPRSLIAPRIEGDPRVGEQLTCTRGDWDDSTGTPYGVTYQWVRYYTGVPIDGATNATYTVTADDLDQYLYCRVTAEGRTDASTSPSRMTSQPTGAPPVNLIGPTISGDRRLRHVLTCNRGSWNDTAAARFAVTYRWRRNGLAISGATSSQRTVAPPDVGQSLSCDVTAEAQTTASSSGMSATAPEIVAPPGVSGDPRLRRTLSCSRGDWNDEAADRYAITYRWLRNSSPITAATGATYQLTAADVNTTLTCEVRAENLTIANSGSIAITAPRITLSPSIAGNPRPRGTLTCSRGTWDDLATDRYVVAYQWMRGGVAIDGATGTSHSLTSDDIGTSVSCVVRAENTTDATTVNYAYPAAPQIRVAPRISGRARLRQTLACSRGDWDDVPADRYAVSYRWQRDGVVVPGAAASTYVVGAGDVNHYVNCVVRAEDRIESASAWLPVSAPANVTVPAVSGAPRMFRELACSRGDWNDTASDRYAVTYAWLRDGVPVPGATQPTYAAGRDDVGTHLYCRVRAEHLTDATSLATYVAAPNNTLRPAVSGRPHLGGELTCTRGTWDDTSARRYAISHQWYRSGVPINGATETTYVVAGNDIGNGLTCSAIAEGLAESFADYRYPPAPASVDRPRIEGVAHPRRELTCTRGEWNDSAARRYTVSYQWRRDGVDIVDGDRADHVVTAEDVGTFLSCVVTAEGNYPATSSRVYATWEPLQLSVVPDADAVAASAPDVYTVRLRNANPVPVAISTLELTLPGGFSYRPGTTTGALTADPALTGPGALTLRWSGGFTVAPIGDAVVRVGVTAASQAGDHLSSSQAFPVDYAFTIPDTGQTGRVTVEGPEPTTACTIVGTAGPNLLTGTPGADVICGLGGDDVLRGNGGADQLWGGPGDDRLEGGADPDALRGGDGADILDGGTEADVLRGGGGLDTLTYATRTTPVTVTLGSDDGDHGAGEADTADSSSEIVPGRSGADDLTGDDGAAGEADTAASDIEIVRGGSGADDLTGGAGPDELYGRAGNDRLVGGVGAGDLLDGADGADTLIDDDGLIDRLICGGGIDAFAADRLDRVVGCETPFSTAPSMPT